MRVMVFVKATKDSEEGVMPKTEMFEAMGKFNEELVNAGIMKAGDGLKPSSKGKRVAFDGPTARSLTVPLPKPRNSWPVTGSGTSRIWTRRFPG